MICSLSFKESNDLSISNVSKQVCCNICQEVVHHSDIEVVNRIPDNPQDNDKDESSDDEDQDELIDASNLQENSE